MSRLRFVIIAAVLSFEKLGDASNLKQSQESGMFAPIGHPDHKNVVELVHPVDLGQQLVDDGVVHLRSKLDNYNRQMKASFTPELSPPLDPRALQIASISSKMMMCRPVLMIDDGDDEDICDCVGGQKSKAIFVFQFRQHHQRTEEAIMVSIKQCLGKRT